MNIILRYRFIMIVLIVATQIFSPVLFIPRGESFGGSVFRLVLLVVSGGLFLTTGFGFLSQTGKRAVAAIAALSAWMFISLWWTPDFLSGVRQLSYSITILLLIYTFDLLVKNRVDFTFLCKIFVFVGFAVAVASLYELVTGTHFFGSQIQDMAELDPSLRYTMEGLAWFTFGNPNDLAIHLIVCSFVSIFLIEKSVFRIVMSSTLVVLTVYLAYFLEARLALIAMFIFVGMFAVGYFQKTAYMNFLMAVSASAVGASLVLTAALLSYDVEFIDVSTFIRLQLLNSAIEMALSSLMVGVGTGGFDFEMTANGFTRLTYGIVDPHNAMGRVLAENGIVGLLLLGFLLFGPLVALLRKQRSSRYSAFVAAAVTALPMLFSAGSDPLSSSSLQLAIALVWAFARFAGEGASDEAHSQT